MNRPTGELSLGATLYTLWERAFWKLFGTLLGKLPELRLKSDRVKGKLCSQVANGYSQVANIYSQAANGYS